jgi:hypothetical protein
MRGERFRYLAVSHCGRDHDNDIGMINGFGDLLSGQLDLSEAFYNSSDLNAALVTNRPHGFRDDIVKPDRKSHQRKMACHGLTAVASPDDGPHGFF